MEGKEKQERMEGRDMGKAEKERERERQELVSNLKDYAWKT